ncbi:MAG: histidine phosphatase family protein [Lewinellaceae bacterium]|nr:histidine phosphatase family protein [Saprospiraceae bacterium]MCB9340074.1 histidine phosphatase family protein [Lewinellaceae bacterium]
MKNSCLKSVPALILMVLLSGCTTHIYLVRHAEKMDESVDPPLSNEGNARAIALKDRLLGAGIDSIFATPYQRTQLTVTPLANALAEPITVYGTDTTFQFVQAIKRIKGKDIVVAGHSNTIPDMVLYLTGDTVAIAPNDYDNLFIVKLQRSIFGKKSKLTQTTYGAPSP